MACVAGTLVQHAFKVVFYSGFFVFFSSILDDFCHIGAIYLNITLSYNWGFEQLNRGNTCSIIKKAVGGIRVIYREELNVMPK